MKAFKNTDALIVSTDTSDSVFVNYLSVDLHIPSIHISLHDRARSGSVYRVLPKVTGCKQCIGNSM